jgi:hypothetical protein
MSFPDDSGDLSIDGLDQDDLDELRSLGWVPSTKRATRRPYQTGIPPILQVGVDIAPSDRYDEFGRLPIIDLSGAR